MVAKLVHYSGRVQGVGFRYTSCSLAEGLPLAGHVRNLPDGRVELFVQGDEAVVAGFLAVVQRRLASAIAEHVIEEREPEELTGFTIRY
ncbi:MAG: acylphosphatase [Planctomycetes bacterium]|nr:acylphosphatase [Planctomycetota bacterium]